jgi:hypothetical protein
MKKLTALVSGMLLSASISIASLSVFALAQGTPASEATPSKPPQAPTPTPTTALTPTPTPTPTQVPATEVTVKDVYKLGPEKKDDYDADRGRAGIGDSIVVVVNNLKNLVDRANCKDEKGQNKQGCQDQKIALFMDGIKIEKLFPETINVQPGGLGTLRFHLERNADSDHAWADLLGAPPLGKGFFERETSVSVGLNNEFPILGNTTNKFKLIRVHLSWFIGCLVGMLVLLYFLLRLAKSSALLRDFGPGDNRPYSLARCQMAFWFFMVIASYLFIWMVTNAVDIITPSALMLIGIGAGTALGSAAIDKTNGQGTSKEQGAQPQQPLKSEGFLKDILTDPFDGVSFHRFQMLAWTVVLGALFLYSVWHRLSMPDFGSTLLALQGISAGTYLGFKSSEKQK